MVKKLTSPVCKGAFRMTLVAGPDGDTSLRWTKRIFPDAVCFKTLSGPVPTSCHDVSDNDDDDNDNDVAVSDDASAPWWLRFALLWDVPTKLWEGGTAGADLAGLFSALSLDSAPAGTSRWVRHRASNKTVSSSSPDLIS